MRVEQAKGPQQAPRWLPLKERITNNRAQRGEVLSFAFDICHTSFLLLINIKHILKGGAHSSKNLPSRLGVHKGYL